MSQIKILALKIMPCDSVATVLEDVHHGDVITVKDKSGNTETVTALADIPFGHKIAVATLAVDAEVLKYGESLGIATQTIAIGDYVHTHNLASQYGRGDLNHDTKVTHARTSRYQETAK
ncbi:MAG TPA: UxaA family hydrolase [Scandinavium sp.]|jgi:altronate dehydratase small subunit|uniref:UxaA family hydrolase n=1 Tax=Scandinavium sp. TaxID=2830653 RepID=UPI002E319658|nr:UxaA family hydrolase [Scandinavium sp.]HEX4499675.1 UxaA family hydrolase [Scandinavium sp.]